jgi:hypothetical protein
MRASAWHSTFMSPPGENEYSVVVVQRGRFPFRWEREIYRNGKPLPVRFRDGNFRQQSTAEAAGKEALRKFLQALAREQNN